MPTHPRLLLLRTLSSLLSAVESHARSSAFSWVTSTRICNLRRDLLSLIPPHQPEGEPRPPSNSSTTPPPAASPGAGFHFSTTGDFNPGPAPTSHPDILRADISDLLSLIDSTHLLDSGLLVNGGPRIAARELVHRCRAHITPETPHA